MEHELITAENPTGPHNITYQWKATCSCGRWGPDWGPLHEVGARHAIHVEVAARRPMLPFEVGAFAVTRYGSGFTITKITPLRVYSSTGHWVDKGKVVFIGDPQTGHRLAREMTEIREREQANINAAHDQARKEHFAVLAKARADVNPGPLEVA